MNIFCQALYSFEDLILLPSPPNYFLIDFKESRAEFLQKMGAFAPYTPRGHATAFSSEVFLAPMNAFRPDLLHNV